MSLNYLIHKLLVVLMSMLAILGAELSHGADIQVGSANEIATAMKEAQPGDRLVMREGVWENQRVEFAGKGKADEPITLAAESPGAVVLTGTSILLISGEHLVVDGLVFRSGTVEDSDHVIQFRGKQGPAINCRLTNTVIDSYNPLDRKDRYHWVSLYGQRNRVDHCRFSGQTNSGVTLVAWLDDQPAEHRVDHNHFLDRSEGDGNGFETIRLGTSGTSSTNARIVVEHNLFERCDGEMEIISNKSNENVFRNNTFKASAGTLTLRHGHRAQVIGNRFIGEGKARTGGLRIIGEGHLVADNLFQGLDDRADGAISLTAGIRNTKPSGYQHVRDVLILNNTVVGVQGAGITLDWGHGKRDRWLLPERVRVEGNLFLACEDGVIEGLQGEGWIWTGNQTDRAGIDQLDGKKGFVIHDETVAASVNRLLPEAVGPSWWVSD